MPQHAVPDRRDRQASERIHDRRRVDGVHDEGANERDPYRVERREHEALSTCSQPGR